MTLTVGMSALGNRSTPRPKKENPPSTTRNMTSMVAKTGRRTHNSARLIRLPHLFSLVAVSRLIPWAGSLVIDADRHPLFQLLGMKCHPVAGAHTFGKFDLVAEPVSKLYLALFQAAILDDEYFIGAEQIVES